MKRTIILLLYFILLSSSAHAKIFSIGPRIGVNSTNVDVPQGSAIHENLQLSKDWGYQLGIFARFDLFTIYIQPELLFTGSGIRFSQNNQEAINLNFNKLDMPVMVGLSLLGVMRAQTGPVFSLLFSAVEGIKDVKEHYKDITMGWQVGLGVDIWNLVIDFKYEKSLDKFGSKIAGVDTDHRHALWILSLGFNML